MRGLALTSALAATALAATLAPAPATTVPLSDTSVAPAAVPPGLSLTHLGSYETGLFEESAAEIVSFDPVTQQAFVVNAASGAIDILDLSDPADPTFVETLSTAGAEAADGSVVPDGATVNSVKVFGSWIAVATEAPDKTDVGWALFYGTDGSYLGGVRVGALPDMITTTPAGDYVLVANEGEPADDFSSDPEGSVSIIPITDNDPSTLTQEDVSTARFTAYDEGTPLPEGVRVFGPDVPVPDGHEPAGRVARNLEPEYIVTDVAGSTAYVALQEANAIATIDIATAQVTDLWAIPLKDWSTGDNVFDASDRDEAITLQHWPVTGLAMPDGIAIYEVDGQTLLVTANEGDAREWGDYLEPVRIGSGSYPLCEDVFGGPEGVAALKAPEALGRLNATIADGLREGEDCYEEIFVFGGRSMSILTTDGELVYDSAGLIEQTIVGLIEAGELPEIAFNANHNNNPSFDTRSDDKGPEPEDVTIGQVGPYTFAFVGLERIGGVMTFDITDPWDVRIVDYVNTRDWDIEYDGEYVEGMGDLGAEGVEFVPATHSPDGRPLVIVGNEVSGSTAVFAVELSSVDRLAGADRYGTAAELSEQFSRFDVDTVFVTTGQDYPDALVASSRAGAAGVPVLLTRPEVLPAATVAELERLAPETIVVVGGEPSVSDAVLEELADLAGLGAEGVTRVAGDDRYGTAVALAQSHEPGVERVYLATGQDFADALVGGAPAAIADAPVLLTRPGHLPAVTAAELARLEPAEVVILGDEPSVSAHVADLVADLTGSVVRVAGAHRYETAALLSEEFGSGADLVFLTTGQEFPDALAGGAVAGQQQAPVLLTRPDLLPSATAAELARLQPRRIVVLGGPDRVSEEILDSLAGYLP